MDGAQLELCMRSLGCTQIKSNNYKDGEPITYLYRVDPEKNLASRLAGWGFSKKIVIDFDGLVARD
jgi:hypothetical protein